MSLPVVYWSKPHLTSLLIPSPFSKKFSHTLRSLAKLFSMENWVLLPYCQLCHTALLSLMTSWEGRMTFLWHWMMTLQRMLNLASLESKTLRQVLTPLVFWYNFCNNVKREQIRKIPFPAVVQALSISDLQHLLTKEVTDLESNWVNHIAILPDHFGATDYEEVEPLSLNGDTSSSLHRIWRPSTLWPSNHDQELLRLSAC